jgi:hypothetical protein
VRDDAASGRWYSVDRHGERHRIKNPFRQAAIERHAVIDQFHGHALRRQWKGDRLVAGHAVVFPDIADSLPLAA